MRSFFTASALTFGLLTATSPAAEAQSPPAQQDPLAGTIRSIIVEGNQRIEDRTVQSYLLVEPGSTFDLERIDLSLKTLFATGLFADVSIDRLGSDLVVRVVENPIINRVIFEGNRALNDERLSEEIQAAPRGIFTQSRVQSDVQRILEAYRRTGRFAAQVNPQYRPLDQNRVDLIFEISDGPVTGVRSINFIGNDAYSDTRLRSEIVTRQSRFWRFFSSNDNYDPNRLEFDRELLRQFYQNNGYYDFRVSSAVAELTPDQRDFYVTFTVEEGVQYEFGEIDVETTLDKLNSNALARAVPIAQDSLYRAEQIENAIDTLTFGAGIAGYAFVDIRPQIVPNPDTRKVDVTFVIDEGPRVYIERINIVGNTTTLDQVIRRELRISEGDAFNRRLLDRSRNRIRGLGYFQDVVVEERPGTQADRTEVDIVVSEQPTGELSFAAGFSSIDAFLIDVSVAQRNLRGRGQSLVARISASQRQQSLQFQFTEPRFLDRNLAAGVDLFATRSDFSDVADFESQTIGGGLRLGFPITDRASLGLRYRISQDKIDVDNLDVVVDGVTGELLLQDTDTPATDVNGDPIFDEFGEQVFLQTFVPPDTIPLPDGALVVDQCDDIVLTPEAICASERNELTSLIGYTFNLDFRNDPVTPTRGFDFSLSQDLAGLGGDVQFLRSQATAATYRGILPGVRASLRFSAGYILPFGNDENVRINNRFFRGGNNFRGFNVAGIGPRVVDFELDENGEETGVVFREQALGGQAFYQGTLEVSLPNFLPEAAGIRTALFVEAGGLGVLSDADIPDPVVFVRNVTNLGPTLVRREVVDDLTLRASAGLSVFWRSPFGPIRFDLAEVIEDEAFDRPRGFRFSTTTQF